MSCHPHRNALTFEPRRRTWLAAASSSALTLACTPGLAVPRRDSSPLILASEAPPDLDPRGWLVSEKLDGARAWWDGTRLRFRSGLPIFAPAWFTAALPSQALDGELWLGRGRFEELSSIVRRNQPVDTDWRRVKLMVFELPGATGSFAQRAEQIRQMASRLPADAPWQAVDQFEVAGRAALKSHLESVVKAGGEGLMLHRADALYETGRSPWLLKLKPQQDADAVVVGYQPGQGRHVGRLGALKVRTDDGKEFLLGTGLSDAQRDRPPAVGAVVTFTYQGTTAQGIPRFASFLRVRTV
ncbi:MAG: DNA ligase [Betaproteobacteria bacterium]